MAFESNLGPRIEIPDGLIWGDAFEESCLISRLVHRLGGDVAFTREELEAPAAIGVGKGVTDATLSVPPIDEERVVELPPLSSPSDPETMMALGGAPDVSARVLAACVVRLGGKLALRATDRSKLKGQVSTQSNRTDDGGFWMKVEITYPEHEAEV